MVADSAEVVEADSAVVVATEKGVVADREASAAAGGDCRPHIGSGALGGCSLGSR